VEVRAAVEVTGSNLAPYGSQALPRFAAMNPRRAFVLIEATSGAAPLC
jgi:hypothetical protein